MSGATPSAAVADKILPETPLGLHHVAYVTQDAVATVDFYTRVLRMPLITTVINTEVAVTNDPYPYLHLFFRLWDGSCIAFFESPGLPPPPPASSPAYGIFNHLALNVGSREQVDRWAAHLDALGIDYVTKEHGIIYSLYLHDPSGHRIELTCSLSDDWQSLGEAATEDMRQWDAVKRESGGDVETLRAWLRHHRKYPGRP
jgi:catechol 2,3-dioxygenase-like lactoylglutathione lyase family enzyme